MPIDVGPDQQTTSDGKRSARPGNDSSQRPYSRKEFRTVGSSVGRAGDRYGGAVRQSCVRPSRHLAASFDNEAAHEIESPARLCG